MEKKTIIVSKLSAGFILHKDGEEVAISDKTKLLEKINSMMSDKIHRSFNYPGKKFFISVEGGPWDEVEEPRQ